jgi:ubiquinone/menaquinone biosynthesis C-methylase UbiE
LEFVPEAAIYPCYADYRKAQLIDFRSQDNPNQERFIDQLMDYPRDSQILDVACGEGLSLKHFQAKGFTRVEGFEWDPDKVSQASQYGYRVHQGDMHDLHTFPAQSFDVIYCSYALEHALKPRKVLQQFRHALKATGELVLVVPFPDPETEQSHCGKAELGTDVDDGGQKLINVLQAAGFAITKWRFDESEIWAKCKPL